MKVNFDYWESEFYPETMTKRGTETVKYARIRFWLNTKRGSKIYSQLFENIIEESWRKEIPFEKLLFYKLKELLIYLEKQIETGHLTELLGYFPHFTIKQRKLTKNTWITDKRI